MKWILRRVLWAMLPIKTWLSKNNNSFLAYPHSIYSALAKSLYRAIKLLAIRKCRASPYNRTEFSPCSFWKSTLLEPRVHCEEVFLLFIQQWGNCLCIMDLRNCVREHKSCHGSQSSYMWLWNERGSRLHSCKIFLSTYWEVLWTQWHPIGNTFQRIGQLSSSQDI